MWTPWTSWLFVAHVLVSVATCIPRHTSRKRQSTQGTVTGIDSRDENGTNPSPYALRLLILTPGNPFPRLEVRDMQANYPDQWNLYLLALDQMHVGDQEDPLSYYAIASKSVRSSATTRANLRCEEVHGRPYKPVLDAPGISGKIGHSGYCPHSMALFLGWHRPYLALFEVHHIAMEYSRRC